jgi:hypothetical protein
MTIRRTHLAIALTALFAAVLYNVWYFVIRPAAAVTSDARRSAFERPLAMNAGVAQGAGARDPLSIPAPARVDAASRPSWTRDPFLFGDESREVARPAAPAPVAVRPMVRVILYSAARRLAIVNGRTVGIGDLVGDYTVADIERDAVVFTAPSGERLRVPVHAVEPRPVAR